MPRKVHDPGSTPEEIPGPIEPSGAVGCPATGGDDARHRGCGRGVSEHGVAGAQQRGDQGSYCARDPRADHPDVAAARLPANPLARGLRGASTNLIGAVVRDFSDPFFARVIEALVVESMAHGYNVVLGHAPDRVSEAVSLTAVLETRHTDAIILLGDMQDYPQLLADLRQSLVPVVALWQGTSPLEFPTADADDRADLWPGGA